MHPLTLVGVLILTVVVLSAAAGASTSGTTRLGREIGFAVGLLIGLGIALLLIPHMGTKVQAIILLLGATISGGLFGAGVLGGTGKSIAEWLQRRELGSVDRVLGAVLSGVSAVVTCAFLLHLLLLFAPDSNLTRNASHDAVAHWLIRNPLVMLL